MTRGNEKRKKKEIEQGQIPIKWNVPDDIITRFASHIVFQKIEGYFKISFYELKPELNSIEQTEMVADCVSSVIIPPEKIKSLIDLLVRNYEEITEGKDNID